MARFSKFLMKLTGLQHKQLEQALLSAFYSYELLERMVRHQLNENLSAIAGGTDLRSVIFNLIGWAESTGRVEELIFKAREENPGNQELRTVSESLQLVTLTIESNVSIESLRQACRSQVAMEIERRVGRKYRPDLFSARPIEKQIKGFINADLAQVQILELAAALSALKVKLSPTSMKVWVEMIEALRAARKWDDVDTTIIPFLTIADEKLSRAIRDMVARVRSLYRNCFLVKDKAGSGKTTLLCHMASDEGDVHALGIFISSKFEIGGKRSLEDIISELLFTAYERHNGGISSNVSTSSPQTFMKGVFVTLQAHAAELVIYLDGINENRDLKTLDESLINLLTTWNNKPVRFVITCRDIFWNFFNQQQWGRFLYGLRAHDLPGFDDTQIDGVINAYFDAFEIRGRLTGEARDRCRHPLLLRFFCEAYAGRDVRQVENLRLKDLFAEYWQRKREEISDALSLGTGGGFRVENFLFNILNFMSEHDTAEIKLRDVPQLTGEHDLESERSLYKHLLDQDIILEETPPANSFDGTYRNRRVSFVYDEFYDYMMASNYVIKKDWDSKNIKTITLDVLELLEKSKNFEQLRGVVEYLILMAGNNGGHRVLSALLARLGITEVLCSVLPKLHDSTDWMMPLLRKNLIVVDRAADLFSRFNAVRELVGHAEPSALYTTLLDESAKEEKIKVNDEIDIMNHGLVRLAAVSGKSEPAFLVPVSIGAGKTGNPLAYLIEQSFLDIRDTFFWRYGHGSWLSESERDACNAVAKVIWVLWKNSDHIVWEVVRQWTLEGGILRDASFEILRVGNYQEYLTGEESLRQIERWLFSDSEQDQQVAVELLETISVEQLSSVASGWKATDVVRAEESLSKAMRRFFVTNPERTMSVLSEWVRRDEQVFAGIIARTLAKVSLPDDKPPGYYRAWEVRLRTFQGQVSDKGISSKVESLIRHVRDLSGRVNNQFWGGNKKTGAPMGRFQGGNNRKRPGPRKKR